MSRQLIWRALAVVGILVGAGALVAAKPARLGLDLRGGTQIVLEAQETPEQDLNDDTLVRALEVLRRRVDQLGVSEPNLQRSGGERIIIELPGVTDPEEALEVIGKTAQLTFHPVEGVARRAPRERGVDTQDGVVLPDESGVYLRLGPPPLTGDAVGDAEAVVDTQTGANWQVSVSFRGEGADRWTQVTGDAACAPVGSPQRRVAIVLDEKVISSPEVDPSVQCNEGIGGGPTSITGGFDAQEAKDLALLIRAGALPVPVEIVEQHTVGPTLGDAAIRASIQAALIGGLLTICYMIAYYRLLGVLAGIALVVYGLLSYAALLAIGTTLTLPGIAGFVLAIGMAVDANVLVFERGKEEVAAGKTVRAGVLAGFKKAWSAIIDSNATTLLAALILFFLASGAVRGFGITLSLGVVVSMFTALVVTRLLVETVLRARRVANPMVLGLNVGGRLRQRLDERPIDIMSRSKYWFAISGAVLALAIVGLVSRGLNFGLEFTGGRLIEYRTTSDIDVDELRSELADGGLPRAVVQETGEGNVAIRSGELSESAEEDVVAAVEAVGGTATEVRDEFIGPSIGDELRRKAVIALAIGLTAQLLYLAIRFRWTYGASAVVALVHDVMILLGIFAWFGKDIDGVFIAALLSVIGYSINDSVVVFDRIREQRALQPKEPLAAVANEAALQTVPRTINTGLGALFILVSLYLLGGDTLTDFALALIVGILVGTYSSVLTAAPVAIAFERLSGVEKALPVHPAQKVVRSQREGGGKPTTVPALTASLSSKASPAPKARAKPTKRRRRKR
ncbi:MAG: protein translocase subunit SecD [Actinomycetota bacterium]|nr:protein translocase subunit SecD [Actinomycetota bacterium]